MARTTLRTLDRKVSDLQSSLDSLSIDETDVTRLKSSLTDATSALKTAESDHEIKAWDTQTSSLEAQISQVEETLREIQTELTTSSAQSELRAKVDVLKAELKKKQQGQTSVLSEHGSRYKALVGTELTATSGLLQINVQMRRKQEDLEEAERAAEGATKETSLLEAKVNNIKEQLKDKRHEKNDAAAKILVHSPDGVDEFPAVLEELENGVSGIKQ